MRQFLIERDTPRTRRTICEFIRSQFVDSDEFYKLLLSNRKMVRCDEPSGQVRGIVDLETKTRFLIRSDDLR